MARIIVHGAEARQKLLNGVNKVYACVASTLGHGGRNAITDERQHKIGHEIRDEQENELAPIITNDGVSIATQIVLKDKVENLGAQAIIDTARKTEQRVGDGTTTSIVIAHKIINEAIEKIDDEHSIVSNKWNAMQIRNEIHEAKDKVIEELKKISKPVKNLDDLENVGIISTENEEYGKMIAGIWNKIGKDGFIHVEESKFPEIQSEAHEGLKIFTKFCSPYVIENQAKGQVVKVNTPIIVTNHKIENTATQIKPICDILARAGTRELVVIADGFKKEVVLDIVVNKTKGQFNIIGLNAPSLTEEEFEDVAVYCGAKFVNKYKDENLEMITQNDLGSAERIISKDKMTVMIAGRGTLREKIGEKEVASKVDHRIKELKETLKNEESSIMQNRLKQRIASLTSGVGMIKVGAVSESERIYKKRKIDDGVLAVKAAMKEGIVPGGGLALKKIAQKFGKDFILYNPLIASYNQIEENAGKFEVTKNIIDPTKVVRVALENACDVAGMIITCETAIVEESKASDRMVDVLDERFKELIKKLK